MTTVVIADDHHLVRQGIRALLEKEEDIQVVGEAADGHEAVLLVEEVAPDIVIMDIAMPRLDGVQATERIRALNVPTKVLILSVHDKRTIAQRALRQGAHGYLLKNALTEELLLAIQAAKRGEIYLSPGISQSILDNLWLLEEKVGADDLSLNLSPREREVLQLIVEGHTNKEVGQILQISPKTVDKHRASIMTKLGVNDITGLIRIAIREGLAFLGD